MAFQPQSNRRVATLSDDESDVFDSEYLDLFTLSQSPNSSSSAYQYYDNSMKYGDRDSDMTIETDTTQDFYPESIQDFYPESIQAEEDMHKMEKTEPNGNVAVMKNSTVLLSVGLGIGLGVLLVYLKVSPEVSELVALPGNVFIRCLKCFVVPMIFLSLSTGMGTIIQLGKVSAVGCRAAALFLFNSTCAAGISTFFALIFRSLHGASLRIPGDHDPTMSLRCSNGLFMEYSEANNTVFCNATEPSSDMGILSIVDLENAIKREGAGLAKFTLADQIDNIVYSLVPMNIFTSMRDSVLLSIITFAICFGAAAMKTSGNENSKLLLLLNQLSNVIYFLIARLIEWSPMAIVSLIASSLGAHADVVDTLRKVGIFVMGFLCSMITMEFVFLPFLLFIFTKRNPYTYMMHMIPCAAFAFGCASSLATLPITMRCVDSTREVSRALVRFVTTVGCTVNMNGSAMFFPAAVVFLATTTEQGSLPIGILEIVLIVIVSMLTSIAVAPIPNAALVMVFTVWSTVFPKEDLPVSFTYIVAVEWLVDRFETVCNVMGDTFCARIIAEQVDETHTISIS